MSEHEHTEACGSTPETDSLLARLNDPTNKLSERQFRELRGKYFTIRHPRVKECGHALDQINEPTFRNCQTCWFSFFSTHAELVTVTDEAFREHGAAFVDKMRGRRYRTMFTRFMATMARFKQESDTLKLEQESQEKLNEQQTNRVSGTAEENPSREITNSEGLVSEKPYTNTSEGQCLQDEVEEG